MVSRLVMGIALALVVLLSPFGAQINAAGSPPFWPTIEPGLGWTGDTDGASEVWVEQVDDPNTWEPRFDVWVASLVTGEATELMTGLCQSPTIRIDGDLVVLYMQRSCNDPLAYDIQVRNIATGEQWVIPDIDAAEVGISGEWIVASAYVDVPPGDPARVLVTAWNIDAFDTPIPLIEIPPGRFRFDGDRIVWDESDGPTWHLRTLRVGETSPTTIASGDRPDLFHYDFQGNVVVYSHRWELYAYDVQTGETLKIPGRAKYPTTNGRYIFWEDTRFIDEGTDTNQARVDLRGYDLELMRSFAVVSHRTVWFPLARGNVLVYSDRFAVWIDQILPEGQTDPGTTSPDWLYFHETAHYLAFGFKDFWLRSGGLPVFGYPLTEEFREFNQTVQYLERQRFEYHPEHAGTPYEVELGHLGWTNATSRGLAGTQPFQPLSPATGSDPMTDFFPETRHRLGHEFRGYWHSHGLEFGDAGVSFRESLALFGYPISEEFTDPETGLTVQYFERARFEYHPDKPESYRVLLGRLGAELLEERGWVWGD